VSRRSDRRTAVFLLYQRDLLDAPTEELYEAHERDTGEAVTPWVREHVDRAWRDRAVLDRAIDEAATDWSAERMATLERSILRLSICELRLREEPSPVVIDEAVGLAKRYASPEASSLVNGILGKIARTEGVGT
jgi:N utilization substance protein B